MPVWRIHSLLVSVSSGASPTGRDYLRCIYSSAQERYFSPFHKFSISFRAPNKNRQPGGWISCNKCQLRTLWFRTVGRVCGGGTVGLRGGHIWWRQWCLICWKNEMKDKQAYWKTGIEHQNGFYLGFSPDITTIKEEVRSSILVICFPDGQGRVKRSERQQSASPSGQWTGRDLWCKKKYNPVELIKQISYRHVTSGFLTPDIYWH